MCVLLLLLLDTRGLWLKSCNHHTREKPTGFTNVERSRWQMWFVVATCASIDPTKATLQVVTSHACNKQDEKRNVFNPLHEQFLWLEINLIK